MPIHLFIQQNANAVCEQREHTSRSSVSVPLARAAIFNFEAKSDAFELIEFQTAESDGDADFLFRSNRRELTEYPVHVLAKSGRPFAPSRSFATAVSVRQFLAICTRARPASQQREEYLVGMCFACAMMTLGNDENGDARARALFPSVSISTSANTEVSEKRTRTRERYKHSPTPPNRRDGNKWPKSVSIVSASSAPMTAGLRQCALVCHVWPPLHSAPIRIGIVSYTRTFCLFARCEKFIYTWIDSGTN